MTHARHLSSRKLWKIIYHFEALDVSFPTQLEPPHLDFCSSSYGRLSAKRSGLIALRFLHFFMSSPTLHAFLLTSSIQYLPYEPEITQQTYQGIEWN